MKADNEPCRIVPVTLLFLALVGWTYSFAATGCRGDKSRADKLQQSWPAACQALEKKLGPEADITFSKIPSTVGSKPFPWKLVVSGLQVTVPDDTYDVLPGLNGNDVTVILRSPTRTIVLIKKRAVEPMKDVFAKVGELPIKGHAVYTARLFGKLPTLYDLWLIGYKHKRGALSCKPDKAMQEIPIAISLALKSVGPGNVKTVSVYEKPFGLPGVAFSGRKRGGRWGFETHLFFDDMSFIVTYMAKDQEAFRSLLTGVRLAKVVSPPQDTGPTWLGLLGRAATSRRDAEKWKQLKQELVKARASKQSLAAVDRVLASLQRGARSP